MKNEDAFNKYLSHELKKLRPRVVSFKMAEKFHIGVPDFQLVGQGHVAFFECKFLRKEPKLMEKAVLKHPFGGAQLTFLRNMATAGAHTYGVIALDFEERIQVISSHDLPACGNWSGGEFELVRSRRYDYGEIREFASHLLGMGYISA